MTAVEYLFQLIDDFGIKKIDRQAILEIEKQQIIDAFNLGQETEAKQEFLTKGNYYYDKQFKKK